MFSFCLQQMTHIIFFSLLLFSFSIHFFSQCFDINYTAESEYLVYGVETTFDAMKRIILLDFYCLSIFLPTFTGMRKLWWETQLLQAIWLLWASLNSKKTKLRKTKWKNGWLQISAYFPDRKLLRVALNSSVILHWSRISVGAE